MKKVFSLVFMFLVLSVGIVGAADLDNCIANAGAYYDQQNDDCLWASQQDPNFNLPACFGSVEQQFSQDLGTCYRLYGFDGVALKIDYRQQMFDYVSLRHRKG